MRGFLAGLLACVPMALGSPPLQARAITGELCGGGTITLEIPGRPPSDREQCPMKACHAASCREKFDRDQGRSRD